MPGVVVAISHVHSWSPWLPTWHQWPQRTLACLWSVPIMCWCCRQLIHALCCWWSPVFTSQSLHTIHSLPSPTCLSRPSHLWLIPSVTTLILPGTWKTSMIWCGSILSRHLVCVAFSLSFNKTLGNAWQSISILTGNPYMMFENLSSENFSTANLGEEGQCLAYTSPSGYNFNIDMNYMSI